MRRITLAQSRLRHLRQVDSIVLPVTAPFNFRYTLWKPSHFPTGLEAHTPQFSWRTFRLGETRCGVRLEMAGNALRVDVFASGRWTERLRERLKRRLIRSYGLAEDIGPILVAMRTHRSLRPALDALEGMRISCPESLFEISIISLLLQNTTVGRSRQMMSLLLSRYGATVDMDGCRLWSFFSPHDLDGATEAEFRTHSRLGYRAKYLPAFTKFFIALDDDSLVGAPHDRVVAQLQGVRGVGPYTSGVIASSALRDPAAIAIDVWNRRLLARRIFGVEDMSARELEEKCRTIFPGYAGLAALYLIEFEYKDKPLDPLLPNHKAVCSRSLLGL